MTRHAPEHRMTLGMGLMVLISLLGCVEPVRKQDPITVKPKPAAGAETSNGEDAIPKPDEAVRSITGPNARELCRPPSVQSKNPETFEDVVTLLNAMPKPVSVACFLDVLEPPLYLNATSNMFSGQPAGGYHSPRIFLFVGKALVISVVPSGPGSNMIEFSYRLSESESVKGELAFPVTEQLTMDAPYLHILSQKKDSTLCMACHFPERPAPEGFPPSAFVSRWVEAFADYDVPLEKLKKLNSNCAKEKGMQCAVIQSIFLHDEVEARGFGL